MKNSKNRKIEWALLTDAASDDELVMFGVVLGVLGTLAVLLVALGAAWLNRVAWPVGWVLVGGITSKVVWVLAIKARERWQLRRMWRGWNKGIDERLAREREVELERIGPWKVVAGEETSA